MSISAKTVKELRDKTGAGMMDCKKALNETDGDVDKAITYLREKGISKAAKRAGRATTEGIIYSYIHPGSKLGVMIEIDCETDFVARNEEFVGFAKDVAMQIAASNPIAIKRDDIDKELIEKEREIYRQLALNEGKPEKILDKIVDGKIEKYYTESCLLEQAFVKDPDRTMQDLLTALIAKIGENVTIKQFARFMLGQ